MASFQDSYENVAAVFKLAEAARDANYDGSEDFGEQADRLSEIAALSGSAAKAFAAANKALGG